MKKLLLILICLFVSFEVKSKELTTEELLNLYEQPIKKSDIEWYVTGVYQSLMMLDKENKLCIPTTLRGSLEVDSLMAMTSNYISENKQNKEKLLAYNFPLTLMVVLSKNFPCDNNWKTR